MYITDGIANGWMSNVVGNIITRFSIEYKDQRKTVFHVTGETVDSVISQVASHPGTLGAYAKLIGVYQVNHSANISEIEYHDTRTSSSVMIFYFTYISRMVDLVYAY